MIGAMAPITRTLAQPHQDFKIIPWRLLASPWLDPYGTM
ncbi:hypothetical protein SNL152K_10103 [Streptomyces sp. NL15-2K]|nr:hypothetical protein SNL152K_10103 [Streptomyces sp. NL15-2K]